MPERLELVVPGLAEQQRELGLQRAAERRVPRAVRIPQAVQIRWPRPPPWGRPGAEAAASVMAARSLPSGTRMSPQAEVTAENVPRVGV